MESFEELGVAPELVDALTAEGIEEPTDFQESAIPVLLRGNPLLAQASSGSGTLIAYGIPLLQRVDREGATPGAVVLTPSMDSADRLASSLARLAQTTGHRVGALSSGWALPDTANVLFATPGELLQAIRNSRISVDHLQAGVVDGFGSLSTQEAEALQTVFEIIPREAQKILLSQPLTEAAEAFGKAHISRAVHLPPKSAQGDEAEPPLQRGEVFYRVVGEGKESGLLHTVATALASGTHHALLFFRTEDQAADVGDILALHGFEPGAPGDRDCPVWLATVEMEARRALDDWPDPLSVISVSVDVPGGADSLDRRHGGKEESVILVRPREIPHLRDVARRAGYRLIPAKEPMPTRIAGDLDRLRVQIGRALREEDLGPYYLAMESLLEDHSPAEVAAAALALLRRKPGSEGPPGGEGKVRDDSGAPPPKVWVRLFVAVGDRDGVGPGDLLGAIAGEAGVEGSQVGKIEIRDTYSLVEVTPGVADRVIQRLNGTTIRGRAVRVDHDRGGPRGRSGASGRPRRKPRGDPPSQGGI